MARKCEDCGLVYSCFDGHMVMLKDSLWNKVSKGRPKICLCDTCIEKRLGRKLEEEDLKPKVVVNHWYILEHIKTRNYEQNYTL